MSRYKSYPAYKNSGVEWLEGVPNEWNIKRLKYLVRQVTGNAEHRRRAIGLENIESWTGRLIETDTEFEGDGIAFQKSDILFGKLRPYLAKVYLAESEGEAVGDFYVMRSNGLIVPEYIQYLILTREFINIVDSSTYGAKMPRVNWDFLSGMILPVPSLRDQNGIVEYLNCETASIDCLVEKKARFIELLREKRQALINRAITKGLDPNVTMRDSGLEWLGQVPENWEVKPIKYLTSHIGSGKTPSGGATVYQDDGVIFLRSQNIYDDGLRLDDVAYISEEIDCGMRGSRVQVGDVLLNITGASIGRTCNISKNIGPANVNQHVCIIRAHDSDISEWIAECFLSDMIKEQIKIVQNGAGREGLNFEQIGNMIITLPMATEREYINSWLKAQRGRIDTLICKTEQSIDLLKERRTALITAAVTGQIDLREVAQ